MVIYLFRDETDNEIFALSVDVTGENIAPFTPHTEWIFMDAIDTLKFVEPWDIGDFRHALDHQDGWHGIASVGLSLRIIPHRRADSAQCRRPDKLMASSRPRRSTGSR